jgi:hypothetical protein
LFISGKYVTCMFDIQDPMIPIFESWYNPVWQTREYFKYLNHGTSLFDIQDPILELSNYIINYDCALRIEQIVLYIEKIILDDDFNRFLINYRFRSCILNISKMKC